MWMWRVTYNIPEYGNRSVSFDNENDAWQYAQMIRQTYQMYWSISVNRFSMTTESE